MRLLLSVSTVLATIETSETQSRLAEGQPAALTAGYGLAFTVSAAIFAVAAVVAVAALPRTLTPPESQAVDGDAR